MLLFLTAMYYLYHSIFALDATIVKMMRTFSVSVPKTVILQKVTQLFKRPVSKTRHNYDTTSLRTSSFKKSDNGIAMLDVFLSVRLTLILCWFFERKSFK